MVKVIFLFSVFFSQSALSAELPTVLAQKIAEDFPGSKVLQNTSCPLGPKKTESFGVLIQCSQTKKDQGHPLSAIIAYKKSGAWSLMTVPKKIDFPNGMMADFLEEYWSPEGFVGGFEIRCTSPKTDKDINIKANGQFIGKFSDGFPPSVQHFCFSADTTYNSWNCLTINPASGNPESSFIQMNAD